MKPYRVDGDSNAMARQYWIDLFTIKSWNEFLEAAKTEAVTGFRDGRWGRVKKMQQGDYLLCYLTGVSRFIGVLEVTSDPYQSSEPRIWSDDPFPSRVKVNVVAKLTPETAVPIHDLLPDLSIFNPAEPHKWSGRVRGSPERWKSEDGEWVTMSVLDAVENPVDRPIEKSKLSRKARVAKTAESEELGVVTIPEGDDLNEVVELGSVSIKEVPTTAYTTSTQEVQNEAIPKEVTAHTEIQWRLLNLGGNMGLDVWVARNDRSREYQGTPLGEMPRMRDELPVQFDEATTATIELIDVLWLQKNAIVAAFEIESTTSIYSGLLRMSDLIAMQPNINIPLYIVAPDERRDKVRREITRPTFSALYPPLRTVCSYLSFSALREKLPSDELAPYLNPAFIRGLAESFKLSKEQ